VKYQETNGAKWCEVDPSSVVRAQRGNLGRGGAVKKLSSVAVRGCAGGGANGGSPGGTHVGRGGKRENDWATGESHRSTSGVGTQKGGRRWKGEGTLDGELNLNQEARGGVSGKR